jgi:ferredoxin-type protein NapH
MIFQMQGNNTLPIVLKLVSWAIFILIALLLLKRQKMTPRNASLLVLLSVIINGFVLGTLGSFPNPVQPIQKIVSQQFNPTYLVILAVLLIVSLLFGRLFCGYACPVGAFQETLFRIREYFFKKKGYVQSFDKIAPYMRIGFFITMLTLGLLVVPAIELFSVFNPFHFFTFKSLVFNITFWLSVTIFVLSFFIYRPFCRMFCPFGLLASIVTRFGAINMHLTRLEGCTDCNVCKTLCPTHDYRIKINHGECYLCGRCMAKCPKKVLVYGKKTDKPSNSPPNPQ